MRKDGFAQYDIRVGFSLYEVEEQFVKTRGDYKVQYVIKRKDGSSSKILKFDSKFYLGTEELIHEIRHKFYA